MSPKQIAGIAVAAMGLIVALLFTWFARAIQHLPADLATTF